MMPLPLIAALLALYVLGLLALALYVEKSRAMRDRVAGNPFVYTLSLAVYMTTWTYYGSVGQAANSGLTFLTAYLGSSLGVLFWPFVLGRILKIKRRMRITSIADYLGLRHGRSHLVAGLAACIALVGSLPYVALQMKAILASFSMLVSPASQSLDAALPSAPAWAGPALVAFMIVFTILVGVRRLDPTERHQGMVAVVAVESLVKLAAFLAVGLFVSYVLYKGPGDIFQKTREASLGHLLTLGGEQSGYLDWGCRMFLLMPVILFLPRQFHVAVVENSNPGHVRWAVWLLPLYMLLITVFVMPIALGGRLLGFAAQDGDTFVLLLPLIGGGAWLSFFVFLGGFSAGMSMIVINTMAMATMVSNDLILPLVDKVPGAAWVRRNLLQFRWLVVALYLSCGYAAYLAIGESSMLADMGIMSMAAAAQFAPAAVIGLFWRGATKAGALTGLGLGFAVWLYTMAVPALARSGELSASILAGPSGWSFLAPEGLFGLTALPPLAHTVFWSLLFNAGGYVLVSLLSRPGHEERALTMDFFEALSETETGAHRMDFPRHIDMEQRRRMLEEVFSGYHGADAARDYAGLCVERAGCAGLGKVSVVDLSLMCKEAERILGGIIGAASAHKVLSAQRIFTRAEREKLARAYGMVLAEMNLSPDELRRRVDFYQEREALLMNHSRELTAANIALEQEIEFRRKAEAEARAAEEKYRSIFENAVEGIFQTTPAGRVLGANPAVARILGYDSPAELMASLTDIRSQLYLDPDERDRFLEVLRRDKIVVHYECRLRRKDSTPVWVSLHARAIPGEDGSMVRIEGIMEDISERKLAEERMRQADKAVRDIIDSMPSVMIAVDRNGDVIHFNQQAAKRFGVAPDDARGRPLKRTAPDIARIMPLAERAMDMGTTQRETRLEEETPSGVRYLDVMAYPLGEGREAVLRVDDVTERVRVEEMMVQTEKMLSVGGLAAGMAHEINNPLGAVVGAAQNLLRRLEPDRDANLKTAGECGLPMPSLQCYLERRGVTEMVEMVRQSGARAAGIVRNMLEFSRKSEGSFAPVALPSLLDRAVELASQDYDLKKKYDFRQIRIERDYDPALPKVSCRTTEIEQVILNLLRNAAQAIYEWRKEGHEPVITLKTSQADGMARMEVADNGPGMDEGTRRRVFEPFFTTKPVGVGTGLGLSVSYFIVTTNHGGEFSVESRPGQGSKFIIKLPLGRGRGAGPG
jgi:PAS domain S-box-containing protein